jgi:uncharacterized protein (TIGR00255 family)
LRRGSVYIPPDAGEAMIRSMTGYGEAELETPAGRLRAEVRTVNHRFFSANLRLSPVLERHEAIVRETLRSHLPRGHVNFTLKAIRGDGADGAPTLGVDDAKARGYIGALRELKDRFDLAGDVDVALVSRFSDLFVVTDESPAHGLDADQVRSVTDAAARAAAAMRREEGTRLAVDLEGRLAAIEAAVTRIDALAPARLLRERDRMRRTIAELLDGVPLDEDRIAREVALLAERWTVAEEVVRMRSHLELFRETIAAPATEPVGKRLGFLVQEMNREANTLGAKANDAAIEHEVVAVKDEIERLREQIENVE